MSRSLEDVVARWRWPVFGTASVGASWLVDNTFLPAGSHDWLMILLAGLFFVAVVGGVYLHYGELSPGRCRAVTNDGERCSRTAHLGADLCWQHERLHGVELVERE